MAFINGAPFEMHEATVAAVFTNAGRKSIYNIAGIGEGMGAYYSLAEYRKRNGADKTPRQMENALRSAVSKCRKETGRTIMVARYENAPDDGFMVYRAKST